ncbi:MAG: LD-carboxypeptidase [Vicinamibacterales bacterium]
MAVNERTRGGLLKMRPAGPGSRVGLFAPASPFDPTEFDDGIAELRRLGFDPVYDERVFERRGFVAGDAESRVAQLVELWQRPGVDAVIAVRGGYGSLQMLPALSRLGAPILAKSLGSLVWYSDVTSLHTWMGCCAGTTSIHGPMLDRRLSRGPSAYDPVSFLASLTPEPVGELRPAGVEVLKAGEATGPLFGGTLTQLLSSLGTPWPFDPPQGYVLFGEDVGERPYRLDRMLTQMRLAGLLARASAIVFGQMPRCDEADGTVTARAAVADALSDFPGPILYGFPSGHTTTPFVTLPLGVDTRVLADAAVPGLVIEESAVAGGGA